MGLGFFWRSYYECEPGTVFSDELDQCIFPYDVANPCRPYTPPLPPPPQTTTTTPQPPPPTTTPTQPPPPPPTTTTTQPTTTTSTCDESYINCKLYEVCIKNEPKTNKFLCPKAYVECNNYKQNYCNPGDYYESTEQKCYPNPGKKIFKFF